MSYVSIVIPCYNDGKYISKTIASAQAQTFADIEIIVANDHSNDSETVMALESLRKQGIKVVDVPEGRKGPSAARNVAIAASNGEYILPLDADDLIDKSYVTKAVAILDSHPDVNVCHSRACRFGLKRGEVQFSNFSEEALLFSTVLLCTALYRRKLWQKVGGYDESLFSGGEDPSFWFSLAELDLLTVYCLDEVLFHYRVKSQSMSAQNYIQNRHKEIGLSLLRKHRTLFESNVESLYERYMDLHEEKSQKECLASYKLLLPLFNIEWRVRQYIKKRMGRA